MKSITDAILDQAEALFFGVSLAKERASCGNWPEPTTPSDFLMWWLDEYDLQLGIASSEDSEVASDAAAYAYIIKSVCNLLQDAGVTPTQPYWLLTE